MVFCCKVMLTVEPPARNIQAREPVTHPAPETASHIVTRTGIHLSHYTRSKHLEILFHLKNNFLILKKKYVFRLYLLIKDNAKMLI